jgi:hypothetical protein
MTISPERSRQTRAGVDGAAEDAFTAEGGHVAACGAPGQPAEAAAQEAQAHLMATLGIHHEGRYYHFRGYRYVRLEDAVAYARLVGTRASRMLPEDNWPLRADADEVQPPSGSDLELMRSLGVSYQAGRFEFEGFHYDRLADALAYARLRHSPAS